MNEIWTRFGILAQNHIFPPPKILNFLHQLRVASERPHNNFHIFQKCLASIGISSNTFCAYCSTVKNFSKFRNGQWEREAAPCTALHHLSSSSTPPSIINGSPGSLWSAARRRQHSGWPVHLPPPSAAAAERISSADQRLHSPTAPLPISSPCVAFHTALMHRPDHPAPAC